MPIPDHPGAFKLRNIAVAGRTLALAWGDGHESYLPFDDLRRACPCAACKAERAAPVNSDPLRLVRATPRGAIEIRALVPVGAYAVQIAWSDGHETGIWPFETLRRSCPCEACASV